MNHFDELAAKWASLERIERAQKIAAEILTDWQGRPQKTILDYGAGPGLIAEILGENAQLVVGYDPSEEMRKLYHHRLIENTQTPGKYQVTATVAESRTLAADGYDALVCSLVLHHIPPLKETLKEFQSLLKPGGTVSIIDFEAGENFGHPGDPAKLAHPGFTQSEFATLLTETGFKNPTVREAYRGIAEAEGGRPQRPYRLFIATASR